MDNARNKTCEHHRLVLLVSTTLASVVLATLPGPWLRPGLYLYTVHSQRFPDGFPLSLCLPCTACRCRTLSRSRIVYGGVRRRAPPGFPRIYHAKGSVDFCGGTGVDAWQVGVRHYVLSILDGTEYFHEASLAQEDPPHGSGEIGERMAGSVVAGVYDTVLGGARVFPPIATQPDAWGCMDWVDVCEWTSRSISKMRIHSTASRDMDR